MHLGLKAFYIKDDPIEAFKQAYQPEDIADGEKRTVEHGIMILEKYMKEYVTNPFEIVECNGSHLIELSKDVTYAARMDAIIKWEGKTIYVMEHKTTSTLGYYFFETFQLNHQIDGYTVACKDKYGKCEGVLIDAISTKKEVLTTAEATSTNPLVHRKKAPSFMRDIVTRTVEQQNNFGKEVVDIAGNIMYAIEHDSYPMNKSMCNYYGACPFRQLCLYGEGAMEMYEVSVWDARTGKEIKSG